MQPVVHDVVCSPQVRHHVVWMADAAFVQWEQRRGHVHEVVATVFTAEEAFNPSLNAAQWLHRVHKVVLDRINVGVNSECVEGRPESASVSTEHRRRSFAVLPRGVDRERAGIHSLDTLKLTTVFVGGDRSDGLSAFEELAHMGENKSSTLRVPEDLEIIRLKKRILIKNTHHRCCSFGSRSSDIVLERENWEVLQAEKLE